MWKKNICNCNNFLGRNASFSGKIPGVPELAMTVYDEQELETVQHE